MGDEIMTTVSYKRRSISGKALLETNELIFRSPDLRLKIPFDAIADLAARDGKLTVAWPKGTATFQLGAKAEQWAGKIRNPKSLIDKLGVRPGHRVVVLNVRDDDFMSQLTARTNDVSTRLRQDADAIFLGASSLTELDRLAKLRDHIKPDGMIWTVTPKGKGGIKETAVMDAGKAAGLVDVKVAAFSQTHTATKFVIPRSDRAAKR